MLICAALVYQAQIMKKAKIVVFLATAFLCTACATSVPHGEEETEKGFADRGLLWIKHAAEYDAIALQAYQAAGTHLERFLADSSWSALPEQTDAAHLPPAIILDVDETILSNIDFQLTYDPPFENGKFDKWHRENEATAMPGFESFIEKARAAGVEIFFVTNRPCNPPNWSQCSQKSTTIRDIAEAGVKTDADHVLLAQERGWTKEKSTRRAWIARRFRVIMLFGDDLGDFIPCVRTDRHAPCKDSATATGRDAAVQEFARYWGSGWYVLPNPMHGSWTRFLK